MPPSIVLMWWREVEAERSHGAEGADHLALEAGAVGLAGVLHDDEVVAGGELAERAHVAGIAEQVHRQQRAGAGPTARAAAAGSIVKVSRSTSTSTGTSPTFTSGKYVVDQAPRGR